MMEEESSRSTGRMCSIFFFDFSLALDGSVHHIGFVIDNGCHFDRFTAFEVGDKHFRVVGLAAGEGCQAADAKTVGDCQLLAGNRDHIFV